MEHIKSQSTGFVTDPEHGHETSDINIRAVLAFGAFLIFSAVLVHVLLWGVYRALEKYDESRSVAPNPMVPQETLAQHRRNKNTMEPATQMAETSEDINSRLVATFPEPRLQLNDAKDMNVFRVAQDSQLNDYAWVDQKNGIVRIPVSRAMEIIAQRGLPNVPTPPPVKVVGATAAQNGTAQIAPKN